MTDRIPESLLRRSALGLWFCAIAALGLLQFHARAYQGSQFDPNPIAWLWLAGSVVLAIIGAVAVTRAFRGPRRGDREPRGDGA